MKNKEKKEILEKIKFLKKKNNLNYKLYRSSVQLNEKDKINNSRGKRKRLIDKEINDFY